MLILRRGPAPVNRELGTALVVIKGGPAQRSALDRASTCGIIEFQQSREQIEQKARRLEKQMLLAMTAILASMKAHHVEHWLSLLGGKNVVEHSPLYQHWMAEKARETKHGDIVTVLEARFSSVPDEVGVQIRTVTDLDKLQQAITLAAKCTSVKQFRSRFAKL